MDGDATEKERMAQDSIAGRSIAGGRLDFRQTARSRAAGLLSRPMRPMAQALSGGHMVRNDEPHASSSTGACNPSARPRPSRCVVSP
jgi:hypothetical protein